MTASELPHARRLLDRHFRWRGLEVSRMEAFADAVFAIVLALLFLQSEPPANLDDLKAAMKALLPFAVTFLLLTMVWVDHHRYFHRYGLFDKTTFFGNLWLLFLVLVYAYPLKFLFTMMSVMWFGPIGNLTRQSMSVGTDELDGVRLMTFYGIGFGAIYATFALLYRHALRRGEDLGLDAVERHLTVSSMLECLVLVAFALLSVLLAWIATTGVSGLVYFGIGPAMGLLGWRRGAALRRLLAVRGQRQ
jgi:Endosomal/lysosomal potassium channel TMEM175